MTTRILILSAALLAGGCAGHHMHAAETQARNQQRDARRRHLLRGAQ